MSSSSKAPRSLLLIPFREVDDIPDVVVTGQATGTVQHVSIDLYM
jgi:hypothetical protein